MKTFQYFDNPNRSKVLRILFAVSFSLGAAEQASFAHSLCKYGHATLPCNGASGKCVTNLDGSFGGFVANTVKLNRELISRKSIPYIGLHAQVCGNSSIIGAEVQIRDNAVVNNSDIRGAVQITDTAKVENVTIDGTVEIKEQAVVDGGLRERAETIIKGNATIKGNAEVIETSINPLDFFTRPDGPGVRIDGGRIIESNLFGEVQITGNPKITKSSLFDESFVEGNATLNFSTLKGKARVSDHAQISLSEISHSARVYGNGRVERAVARDNAQIYDHGYLHPGSHVSGNVQVYLNGEVNGCVRGEVHITAPMPSKSEQLAGEIFDELPPEDYIGKSPVPCKKSDLEDELQKVNGNVENAYKISIFLAQKHNKSQVKTLTDLYSKNPDEEKDCCQICTEAIEIASLTSCPHLFCYTCVHTIIQKELSAHGNLPPNLTVLCPMCKQNIIGRPILNISKDQRPAEEGERPKLRNFDVDPERFNRFRGPEMN